VSNTDWSDPEGWASQISPIMKGGRHSEFDPGVGHTVESDPEEWAALMSPIPRSGLHQVVKY
jgi:hypothetical protein